MANFTICPATKPRKLICRHQDHHNHQSLIPGLPDHLAHDCLSLVCPSFLYSVCHSWRRLIYSPSFPSFLSIYALLSPSTPQSNQTHITNSINFHSFDPISNTWQAVPTPPSNPPLNFLLNHPSFISRNLPIQTVSVSGKLVLLAATSQNFYPALSRPLIFNPVSQKWTSGPPLSNPRRWCAAGSLRGAVYIASGIGSQFSTNVARSVEKWELNKKTQQNWVWENLSGLKDGKFSRDAIDAIGWRGKLCMVNVKGFAAKEGVVYDMEKDVWEEMAEGMLEGWRGPVTAMDEEEMYVVDETKGVLRKYDEKRDCWEEIMEDERLRGAIQLTAGGGRVCVLSGEEEGRIVVVDVVSELPRVWVVNTPMGFPAVAIHVLPRMSHPGCKRSLQQTSSLVEDASSLHKPTQVQRSNAEEG